MNRKHSLQLFLGVRLQAPSSDEICRLAEQVLDMLRRIGRPIPLHWNFAVSPLLGSSSRCCQCVVDEIRSRMSSRGDRILPAGFTGSVHSHLLGSELERELAWCHKNPWFPALKEVFAVTPETILPFYPDILREMTAGVYSRHGYRCLGLPVAMSQRPGRLAGSGLPLPFRAAAARKAGSPAGAWIQPVLLPPPEPGRGRPDWLKLLPAQSLADSRPFFLLDCSAPVAGAASRLRDTVLLLLEHLGRKPEPIPFEAQYLPEAGQEGGGPSAGELLALGPKAENPFRRRLWQSGTALRAGKKRTNNQVRTVLELMTAPGPGSGLLPPQTATADLEITNVSMFGSVTLLGTRLQAVFQEGRLVNLQERGRGILAGEPAISYLGVDNRRITLSSQSAFAFEREGRSGLRADFQAPLPGCRQPLRVVADYCFPDGEQGLGVDLFVSYPTLPDTVRLTEIAPLEILLCSFGDGDTLSLQAQFPDGLSHTEPLEPRESLRLLYGCRFLIRKNRDSISLSTGCGPDSGIRALEFRVRRHKARYLLAVNLFGSYSPSAGCFYSGLEEQLSFTIGCPAR